MMPSALTTWAVLIAAAASAAVPSRTVSDSGASCVELSSGAIITAPGCYVVTEDIDEAVEGQQGAIEIVSDHVVLDLNGRTVRASGSGVSRGIRGLDVSHVVVRNGTAIGDRRGLELHGSHIVVEDLVVQGFNDSGIAMAVTGEHLVVRNCENLVSDLAGLSIGGKHVLIENNRGVGDSYGLSAGGEDMLIRGNHVRGTLNFEHALRVSCRRCRIVDNTVIGDGPGISLMRSHDVVVSGNDIVGERAAVRIEQDSHRVSVTGNRMRGSCIGVRIDATSHEVIVARNWMSGITCLGLDVYGTANELRENILIGDLSSEFADFALRFRPTSRDNTYSRNIGVDFDGDASQEMCIGLSVGALCDEGVGNESGGNNFLPDPL